jgi:hypothetical protein
MDLIVKQASSLSAEEKSAMGITGIPEAWPIESYPYSGTIPSGFTQMSEADFNLLKANNQAAYDAWLVSIKTQIVQASVLVDSDNIPIFTTKMVDGYDRPQFRRIVTRPTWLYSPRSVDWTTSKYLSIYNRKHDGNLIDDGTDIGDAWLQFYDASGNELTKGSEETPIEFQNRLDASCVKTLMSFEKIISYDIQAAILYLQNEPADRAYLWCIFAPDVPEVYGGSKALMGGGMNLQMMAAKIPHLFDAVSANTINYDSTYHSGKMTAFIKHAVGAKIGMQIVFINYND